MSSQQLGKQPSTALNPQRIVFVVDIRGWAFDTVATSMRGRLAPLLEVCEIVYWQDFDDPFSLIRHINEINPDLVHFFFREHLDLILKTTAKDSGHFRTFCQRAVTTHVPDYLYSASFELASRVDMFHFVDGYFTTCRDLYELYAADPLVPVPHDVIFDWPEITPQKNTSSKASTTRLRVLWSGNSRWGEYAGYVDYKGLETIIRPALRRVQEKSLHIDFTCFDSAQKKVPHSRILEALKETDILLIASEKEGTPLSLIEAMAMGCAVISTKVGITEDVLPQIQKPFICERHPDAFSSALLELHRNRDKLNSIKQANLVAYDTHFGNSSELMTKWVTFLNKSHARYQNNTARKRALAKDVAGSKSRRALVTALRAGVRVAKPLGLVQALNNITPKFAGIYHRVIHEGYQSGKPDYERIGGYYEQAVGLWPKDKPIAVYAPMWKGVAASTEALFGRHVLRYPYFDTEFPEVKTHSYLERLAELLVRKCTSPLVYSGGSLIHHGLATRVRELDPERRQLFLWHGSPAQWVDAAQRAHFMMWQAAYEDGVINGIGTIKPNLHRTLQKVGIEARDIMNPIPELVKPLITRRSSSDSIHIGLFSAVSSWYKNPYPQLLSLAGNKVVELSTNLSKEDTSQVQLGVRAIHRYPHMPRSKFLNILSQQDLTLYVTNTECSPMIALESWALGVPCIVGPAGDVYSNVSDKLAEFLVEPLVDNPTAIADRIELVLQRREEIVEILVSSQRAYQLEFNKKLDSFLQFVSSTQEPRR